MKKVEVDLDDMKFDSHGQQVGVEVPEEMLDEISGGYSSTKEKSNNDTCGLGCSDGNNSTCGLYCLA